jgi:hypothetical protein
MLLKICLGATSIFIFSVLVLCTQVNMMFVMLLWVYIHTGQAWKICLATVGIRASIPKVVGSIPTMARHIFQAGPVWIYTQSINITDLHIHVAMHNVESTLSQVTTHLR